MKPAYHRQFALIAAASLALAIPANLAAQDNEQAASSEVYVNVEAVRLDLAREIVDQGFPPEVRMDVFGGVMQQVVAQLNVAQPALQDDAGILALIESSQQRVITEGLAILETHLDAMIEGMAFGYAEAFTLEELYALRDFVSSPEGHGLFAKSAAVNSSAAYVEASQAYLNEYLAKVPAIQADLQTGIADLLASRAEENDELE